MKLNLFGLLRVVLLLCGIGVCCMLLLNPRWQRWLLREAAVENYYDLLDVRPDCSSAEVKKAYRAKALLYHPDKNKDSEYAKQMFYKIELAHSTLLDDEKRLAYNEELRRQDELDARRIAEIKNRVTDIMTYLWRNKFVAFLNFMLVLMVCAFVVETLMPFIFSVLTYPFRKVYLLVNPERVVIASLDRDENMRRARERQQQALLEQSKKSKIKRP